MRLSLLLVAVLAAPLASAQSLRADGPPVRIAGSADASLAHATWSPTGALAASAPNARGLWLVDEEAGLVPLVDGPTYGFEWSPDGSAILYRATRETGLNRDHAVALLDVATGEATMLTDWRASMPSLPRFSPDGTSALLLVDGEIESIPTGLAPRRWQIATSARPHAISIISSSSSMRRPSQFRPARTPRSRCRFSSAADTA